MAISIPYSHAASRLAFIGIFTPGLSDNHPAGLPICMEGLRGSGKTEAVNQVIRDHGIPVFTALEANKLQPYDLAGIPAPTADGDFMRFLPLAHWKPFTALQKHELGVVFLDELTAEVRSDTYAAMLTLLTERKVGDVRLSPRTVILGACNTEAEQPSDMSAAMRDRWMRVALPDVRDISAWSTHADAAIAGLRTTQGARPYTDVVAEIDAVWKPAVLRAKAEIAAFLRGQPAHLRTNPTATDRGTSDRTWLNLAVRVRAAAKVFDMTKAEAALLMESAVGDGPANDFMVWLSQANLPDPEAVLNGRHALAPAKTYRIDVLAAITEMVTQVGVQVHEAGGLDPAQQKVLIDMVSDAQSFAPDILQSPLTALIQAPGILPQKDMVKLMSSWASVIR